MPRKSGRKELCKSCDKFSLKSNMSRHQKRHAKVCSNCPQSIAASQTTRNCRNTLLLYMHRLWLSRKKFSCSSCPLSFSAYYQLLPHKRNSHQRSIPSTYENVDLTFCGGSTTLHSELQTVQHFLQVSVLELSRKKVHNFKLVELSHETVINKLGFIYDELPNSGKINISFGFVLQSVQSSVKFRYFYAADNTPFFKILWFSPMTQISILSNRN